MAAFTQFLKLYKPVANEDGWDDNMNSNLDIVDGFVHQFMNIANFTGAWANNTPYGVGQVALDTASGSFYTVLVAHTSATTGSFAADRTARPTLWKLTNNVAQDAAAAASTSATQAAASAAASLNSANAASSSFNSFRSVYYGPAATDPATDPLGGARTAGDLYYNTTNNRLRIFGTTTWADVPTTTGFVPEAPSTGVLFGRLSATWVQAMGVTGDQQISNGNFVVSGASNPRKGCVGVNVGIPATSDGGVVYSNLSCVLSDHSLNAFFSSIDGQWHSVIANVAPMIMGTGIPTTGLPFIQFIMCATPTAPNQVMSLIGVMNVDRAGNFTIGGATASKPGGGSWSASSDARVKNVIGPYAAGLAEILEMEPKLFTYKGNDFSIGDAGEKGMPLHQDTTTQYIGVVAQDCQPYMPELVKEISCYIDDTIVNDVLEVDATGLTYALVNAVKTLEARIAALEAA